MPPFFTIITVTYNAERELPALLASLAGVACNRIRRGQARRLWLITRAAWCGVGGKMGKFDLGG